jgi:predicted methyltransferase
MNMFIRFTLCIFTGAALPAQASSPIADVICEQTDRMRHKLERQFGTEQIASGLRSPEEVVEIWKGAQGDWAMVIAYASGRSCIVAMGDHWQSTTLENPT